LVVELDLDSSSTDLGLIRRVELGLNRELSKTEPARSFLSNGWEFLKRLEACGVSLRDDERATDPETFHDEFAHSLAMTTSRIAEADAASVFGAKYDGAGSTGESNTCLQYSRWRLKSQCLSRTLIQP